MYEELIPISMFVALAVVIGLMLWFRYRTRSDLQVTIRTAIEKGQELSPEMVDRLAHPKVSKDRDLRFAIIWLAIAAGLALIGFAVPDPSGHAFHGTLAGAALPFCIGLAYLVMWRFTEPNQ